MSVVTMYWRPGCGFCSMLRSDLDETGLEYQRVNIWEDHDGAAFVRSVADGNETVPTVTVGDVAMVNPSRRQVMKTLASVAPDQLPKSPG